MFVKHLLGQVQCCRLGVWSANRKTNKQMKSLVLEVLWDEAVRNVGGDS